MRGTWLCSTLCAAVFAFAPATAAAGTSSGEDQDVAKKLSNPVADMVSVPLQFNWVNGNGPDEALRFVLNLQPVVPFAISEKWNLIGRWIMPYLSQPASLGSTAGLSDITASAFFSPRSASGPLWGAGPVVVLPCTSDPALGAGHWSAGPTLVVLEQKGPWTYGILWNQIWSFASISKVDRLEVSQGFFQPFLAHVTSKGVTYTLQSESIANWLAPDESDTWTIPINFVVSDVTRFGPFPLSVAGTVGVFVAKPSDGPEWQLRTTFTLVLPSKK